MSILIIDYKCGNVASVYNVLKHLGQNVVISDDCRAIENAEKIIIPGVGSFEFGMNSLRKLNMLPMLEKKVLLEKTPVLGICLGAQLMLNESEESPGTLGLSWIKGKVVKLKPPNRDWRVPHVGWNKVRFSVEDSLCSVLSDTDFYFTHSYAMSISSKEYVRGTVNYIDNFDVFFQKENIYGCQFHPEKSAKTGIEFLRQFSVL